MLTTEMLKQSSALAGLTDEQLNAIAEMSKNDENAVIGTKIGALHGQYDADILAVTGVKKNDGEKSYDYAKRVLGEYKAKADGIEGQLTAAKAQVADLQAKIDKGEGDQALRQQLKDSKAQVTQLQSELSAKQTEFTKAKETYESDLKQVHVDYAFSAATASLKFKEGITESVQKVLLESAKREVLAKGTPDFIDDGKGGKTLVLRGADGNILNNPKNNLNPYTLNELVMETSLKDVVSTKRQVTGGGTGGNGGGKGGANGQLDLSGARTQVEADRLIEQHLLANGITRDSKEFSEQSLQLRTDAEVAKLPIR
jgi:hypothetical protein